MAAAAVGALLWSCGSDGVERMGDAMVDAAHALADAGERLRDASTDAAVAQATAECTISEGGVLYAEAAVTIDPGTVRSVTAIMCGLEGSPPAGLGGLECTSAFARFSASRVRAQCGGGDPSATGFRWRTVRFVIE